MAMDAGLLAGTIKDSLQKLLRKASMEEISSAEAGKRQPRFDFTVSGGDAGEPSPFDVVCAAIAEAVATSVVAHIQAHAEATVIVDPGISVKTAGSATAQTGMTDAAGTGSISPGGIT